MFKYMLLLLLLFFCAINIWFYNVVSVLCIGFDDMLHIRSAPFIVLYKLDLIILKML